MFSFLCFRAVETGSERFVSGVGGLSDDGGDVFKVPNTIELSDYVLSH